MACDITAGRKEPCKNTIGGLHNVYFVNFKPELFAVAAGEATLTVDPLVDKAFKYQLKADGNNFEEAFASDKNTGVTLFTQTVSLVLKKQDLQTNNEVKLLAWGSPHVIVEDRNGNFRVAGIVDGMDVTGGSIMTGGAKADFNGYNITLLAEEVEPAPYLSATSITALEGIVVEGTPPA